jgi:hypothetical protein
MPMVPLGSIPGVRAVEDDLRIGADRYLDARIGSVAAVAIIARRAAQMYWVMLIARRAMVLTKRKTF